jgi:hypothetical protein
MRVFRVAPSGSLTLESITVAGGFVRGTTGIIPNGAGGEARGGAIYNQGTLRIIASTLVNNEVRGGDGIGTGPGGGANGGAVYNNGGAVRIVNATISSNTAQSGSGPGTMLGFGAGIYSRNGALEIYNSTIANNTSAAGRNVYAIGDGGGASVEIHSSIIGQAATSPTIFDLIATTDAGGSLSVSGGDNIIRRQNAFSEITYSNDDPLLGPLVNNGGPTHTHALVGGSPAINRGSNPLAVSTDQRGPSHTRVMGGQADVGAFEVQSTAGPALPGDYNLNQVVDAADYVIWRKTLGSQVTLFAGADGDGNGRVETQDYNVWRTRFGAIGAAATQIAVAASSFAADSPAAGTSAIFFDRSPLNRGEAAKGRSSLIGSTSDKRPSATSADRAELLNVVASSAIAASAAENSVWERLHPARDEMANDWQGAVGNGALNIAFELFDSVSQTDD